MRVARLVTGATCLGRARWRQPCVIGESRKRAGHGAACAPGSPGHAVRRLPGWYSRRWPWGTGPAAAQPQAGAAARPARAARLDAAPGTISTVAGGVGGPAKAGTVSLGSVSSLYQACGVTATGDSLYVGTGNTLRKVNQQTDWLTTAAGADYRQGEGTPAISSAVYDACAVAVDRHGNLVLAELREGPGDRRQVRHVLRAAHDGRGHLHRGRPGQHRSGWFRGSGDPDEAGAGPGGGSGLARQPGDRGRRTQLPPGR